MIVIDNLIKNKIFLEKVNKYKEEGLIPHYSWWSWHENSITPTTDLIQELMNTYLQYNILNIDIKKYQGIEYWTRSYGTTMSSMGYHIDFIETDWWWDRSVLTLPDYVFIYISLSQNIKGGKLCLPNTKYKVDLTHPYFHGTTDKGEELMSKFNRLIVLDCTDGPVIHGMSEVLHGFRRSIVWGLYKNKPASYTNINHYIRDDVPPNLKWTTIKYNKGENKYEKDTVWKPKQNF